MRSAGAGLVLAVALCLPYPAFPQDAEENPYGTTVDARMGGRLFRAECGRCHGRDGKGNDETGAPDLTTGSFKTASSDQALFEVIRDGIPGTTMVGISWAPDHRVWQIVAYLRSLNPQPGDFDLPGNAERGAELFRGKGECSTCHMVKGSGGRIGPDLSNVGNRMPPDELKTALLDPNDRVEPRWWTMKVTRADGSTVEGLRMGEDTFTVRLMDEGEKLWHIRKKEARSIERVESSPMPSMSGTLSESEIDDLVAYLFNLRKES